MNYSVIAFSVGVLATLPLLYQTLVTGGVADHTYWTLALVLLSNGFLGVHGYQRRDSVVIGFAVWFFLFNLVLLYYTHREITRDGTPSSST